MTEYRMDLSIYLVGYFDLMGQAQHLSRLKPFAKTHEDYLEISRMVGTQAATIRQIRDEFVDFSRRVAEVTPNNLEHLPPQAQAQYQRISAADVRISGISDCFVIAAKLSPGTTFEGPEAWAKAASSINTVLLGLAGMLLKALASRIPMRGGVEVGLAMDMTESEVYGRALSDAVALEEGQVSLIRFRGHLPKGGYDVQNGITQDGTTSAATIHRGVPHGRGAAGAR